MSRIRVTQLPASITQQKLQSFFESCGVITHCSVLRVRDSNKPRMAFVGFKDSNCADQAIKKFNGTFMGSAKLLVEKAKPVEAKKKTATEKKQEDLSAMSDMDYLRSLQPEDTSESKKASTKKTETSEADPFAKMSPEELVKNTARLFVTNIPYTATTDELEEHFQHFGPIGQVVVPRTVDTKVSKGVAFVQFVNGEDAAKALKDATFSNFQGRLINVTAATPLKKRELDWDAPGTSSYKRKQLLEQQKKMAANPASWSSVFISDDTAATTLAEKLDINKEEIVGKDVQDAAVKTAIAAVALQDQAKELFSAEGYDLTVLDQKGQIRSDRIIIVKNLPPAGKSKSRNNILDDLLKLFRVHGDVSRVVSPPGSAIALLEFVDADDAKRAFTKLGFYMFNEVPLYLEWAPKGVVKQQKLSTVAQVSEAAQKAIEDEDANTLMVKGITFGTNEISAAEYLREQKCSDVRAITVKKGYMFVEFEKHRSCVSAYRSLNGAKMGEQTLLVEFAKQKKQASNVQPGSVDVHACPKGHNPTKLVVRNVPFEATQKDIEKLFSTFAHVKKIRLPKRQDASVSATNVKKPHRGFAFVDFMTAEEAKQAKMTLANAHLWGRHLVLEYAQDDQSVSAVTEKTKRKSLADPVYKETKRQKGTLKAASLGLGVKKKDEDEGIGEGD